MKSNKFLMVTVIALMMAGSVRAQTNQTDQTTTSDKYFANEFTIDGFATYDKAFGEFHDMFDHSWHGGEYGGGVGLNYYITRYIGVGADTFWEEHGEFWKNVSGSAIFRIPIGHTGLAPYMFGGGGRRFEPVPEWTGHAGVGLEWRFTRHIGIFGDIRYIWADKTVGAALPRAGVRFAF